MLYEPGTGRGASARPGRRAGARLPVNPGSAGSLIPLSMSGRNPYAQPAHR